MNDTLTLCLEILFWFALFVVFYTYLGYGILLYILVKLKEFFVKPVRRSLPATDGELPEVTLFITAFNEEEVVDEKMENCLELDYPADKLHIVWVTDGSNDGTNERLQTRWQGKATVHFQPLRQGKTAAMTRGMTLVDTPLVVFTDANTMVNREAIREIVLAFQDPKVGCVAGEKRIAVAGGVASNTALRAAMKQACDEAGLGLCYPSPIYCTDNAAMIASQGYYEYMAGTRHGLDLNAVPNLKIGQR